MLTVGEQVLHLNFHKTKPNTAYTEQQIRALAINFLRQHYRHRPRSGTSGTRVVYQPHYYRGVTIDARLAFQKPDLAWFMATVEATPVGRAHEVLYRRNWFKIFSHAALAGVVALTLGLALTQVQSLNVWQWMEGRTAWGALLLTFILVSSAAAALLQWRKSYRYIYAVEQFKRFHADAQWIAYDPLIFAGDRRRVAYEELKRQCVLGGFGLVEVLPGDRVRDIIEPSHLDQFAGSRSSLPLWVAAIQPPPRLRSLIRRLPLPPRFTAPSPPMPAPASAPLTDLNDTVEPDPYLPAAVRLDDYAATLRKPKPGKPKWYLQPAKTLTHAKWKLRDTLRSLSPSEIRRLPGYYDLGYWYWSALTAAALVLGALIFVQTAYSPTARVGAKGAAPTVIGLEPAARPELSLADPDLLPGEYNHDFNASSPPPEPLRRTRPGLVVEPVTRPIARYRIDKAGAVRTDRDCFGLYQLPDTYYLLTVGTFPDFGTARAEAERLNKVYGLAVTAVAQECIQLGGGKFLVYLAAPTTEEAQANFLVREYTRKYELPVEILVVD